jgi:deferrochelatase/peroxidase EfeB
MQYYQIWCNLIDSHRDLEFAKNAHAWLTHLQSAGKLEGYRITRRKFGFGPEELGEFNITIWTKDMAQLDAAFSKVAARAGETEQFHRAVYSMVKDFRAGLYRDFPDPERV